MLSHANINNLELSSSNVVAKVSLRRCAHFWIGIDGYHAAPVPQVVTCIPAIVKANIINQQGLGFCRHHLDGILKVVVERNGWNLSIPGGGREGLGSA